MEKQKVWVVTGASKGLGLAMVKHLLDKGELVVATTRDASRFDQLLSSSVGLEVLQLDLKDEQAVRRAMEDVHTRYTRIDVLVNNAGYGFLGAVEEANPEEIEDIIAVNVLSPLRMLRHTLPYMRAAGSGHIINLSSMSGVSATPAFGIYNTTKFAVEGFSEALSQELSGSGIRVTIVEPGAFRTNFLDSSIAVAQRTIADYAATAGEARKRYLANNGRQPGNPEAAARVICDVVDMDDPPLRLLLGKDARARVMQKMDDMKADYKRTEQLTLSTDFE